MAALSAAQGILTILIMIFTGYILTAKGWFDDKAAALFSRIVVNVSLPALMISNLMSTFTRDKLLHYGLGSLAAFISIFIAYILALAVSYIFKIGNNERGLFAALFAFSNTIFIGIPVNQSLFGDKAIPYVLLYYVANTSLFWTIGIYGIIKDGNRDERMPLFSPETVKKILSPALMGFITGVLLILMGIKLPRFAMDTFKYIGDLTTPLSMFFTGIVIHNTGIEHIKFDKKIFLLSIGRFIVSPLLAFAALHFFPLNPLMKRVFIIQSSLPVMTQIAIVSRAYNGDHRFAAMMVTLTTALSLLVIPIYMSII